MTHSIIRAALARSVTILIRWLKLTRLSHIISGNQKQMSYPGAKPRVIPELRRNL